MRLEIIAYSVDSVDSVDGEGAGFFEAVGWFEAASDAEIRCLDLWDAVGLCVGRCFVDEVSLTLWLLRYRPWLAWLVSPRLLREWGLVTGGRL